MSTLKALYTRDAERAYIESEGETAYYPSSAEYIDTPIFGSTCGNQWCNKIELPLLSQVGFCDYSGSGAYANQRLSTLVDLILLLGNRNLTIAADSSMFQVFFALLYDFQSFPTVFGVIDHHFPTLETHTPWNCSMSTDKSCKDEWSNIHELPLPNFTVHLSWGGKSYTSHFRYVKYYIYSTWLHEFSLEGTDVLVMALTFHYEAMRRGVPHADHHYRKKEDLDKELLAFMANFTNARPDRVAIYPGAWATHFATPTGQYKEGTGCQAADPMPSVLEEMRKGQAWRDQSYFEAVRALNLTDPSRGVVGRVGAARVYYLPLYNLTLSQRALHVGAHNKDCVHFCYVPALFTPMFASLNLILTHAKRFEETEGVSVVSDDIPITSADPVKRKLNAEKTIAKPVASMPKGSSTPGPVRDRSNRERQEMPGVSTQT
jgi:hypothetical protein